MPITRNCITCNKPFQTFPFLVKKGYGKYCSRECQIVPTGNHSPNWKGDKVGYHTLHHWVERELGTSKKCEQCGTTIANKYEWANISKEYKRSNGLKDWKRLCTRCHRAFDNTTVRGEKVGNAKLTESQVIKIRRLYVPHKYTLSKLSKIFNVQISTVHDIIKRKIWKHI
jgi:hypothetical protein